MAVMEKQQVEVREIGRGEAVRLLENNTHNRRLRQIKVDELAGAMSRGEWVFNGDPIRIAESGTLLDGQHRLAAIALSGLPQRFVVVSGLEDEAQETMDQGLKRGVGDVLKLRGEISAPQLAAICRALFLYETRGTFAGGLIKPTTAEVVGALDRWPEARDAVRESYQARTNTQLTGSILGACWAMFSRVDMADTTVFFTSLGQGAGLVSTDPIFQLRRQFTTPRPVGNRIATYVQGALIIKAWNAWRNGQEVKLLIYRAGGSNREMYPKVDGLS